MSQEYLERANNLRRSYFSLTGGIEIEFGGSRDFKGHGGLEELGSFFKQQVPGLGPPNPTLGYPPPSLPFRFVSSTGRLLFALSMSGRVRGSARPSAR